jgi:hypothetical protein
MSAMRASPGEFPRNRRAAECRPYGAANDASVGDGVLDVPFLDGPGRLAIRPYDTVSFFHQKKGGNEGDISQSPYIVSAYFYVCGKVDSSAHGSKWQKNGGATAKRAHAVLLCKCINELSFLSEKTLKNKLNALCFKGKYNILLMER